MSGPGMPLGARINCLYGFALTHEVSEGEGKISMVFLQIAEISFV